MNEINRENDIFVSTLLNPEANVNDLIQNGVTSKNTQLLSPEQYKDLDFVKKQFSDKDGNFNGELFDRIYNVAFNKFNDLTQIQSYDDLTKFDKWNVNDIYASIDAEKEIKQANISRVRNPFEETRGIRSLLGVEESNKSVRELAQKNKIFDTETGEYIDKSAEDLGLIGGLFSKPLVYATWDEDGTHFDPTVGREVTHKKGDYKLNEDGKFYTETIGEKQGYGKQFVALSDILTKEDSWLNKIDFFDSDDKEKSVTGTVLKTAARIAPYFIPVVRNVWGGVTAITMLSQVLPTFAKMLEGVAVGDTETALTLKMNLLENYGKRFEKSYSDEDQKKSFGLAQMGDMVADVIGQLYQMKFMSGLSQFSKYNFAEANKKGLANFIKNYGDEYANLVRTGKVPSTENGLLDFWNKIAASSPEMQQVIKNQSELAKKLSLGYMALTSSADVYQEALEGGYSRRVAGLAGLGAAAGQYAIMMNNQLGTWFLNKATGYTEGENRLLTRKAIKPIYEQLAKDLELLAPNATAAEKQAVLAKGYSKIKNALKNTWDAIKNGSSEFWTRSTVEAVEEMTEEAVMDMTKGAVDFLTWCGFGGEKNKSASFNTIQNTFSKEGLARYAQNALGGFIGGSLFQLQEMYVEPWLSGKNIDRNTTIDLITGIQQGRAEEFKQSARDLGKLDDDVQMGEIKFGDSFVNISKSNGQISRGEAVAQKVVEYIEYLEGVLGNNGLNLTDDELFRKVIRDQEVLSVIKDSDITNVILDDFHNAAEKIVKLQQDIDTLRHKESLTDDDNNKLNDLDKQKKELVEQLNDFLSGESYEPYLKMTLAYLNPNIRDNLTNISLYQFAKAQHGQEFSSFPEKGAGTTQESIKAEYEEYKRLTDKKEQMHMLMNVFDELEQKFSPAYKQYVDDKYTDVRKKVIDSILSSGSFNLGEYIKQNDYYSLLNDISEKLIQNKLPGAVITDILRVDKEQVKNNVILPALSKLSEPLKFIAAKMGVSVDQLMDVYADAVANELNVMPIQTWSKDTLNVVLEAAHNTLADAISDKIADKAEADALLISMDLTPDMEIGNMSLGEYIASKTKPQLEQDIVQNLALNTLQSYIMNEDVLDDEMVRVVKRLTIDSMYDRSRYLNLKKIVDEQIIWYYDEIDEDVSLNLAELDFDFIKKAIQESVNKSESENQLVDRIFDYLLNKYTRDEYDRQKKMFDGDPSLKNKLKDLIRNYIHSDSNYQMFQQVLHKTVRNNPLYNLLRNLQVELYPNIKQSIFELLEIESKSLSGVQSISEYVKMPDIIEQLDSAKSVISVAKAILAGMEEGDLNFSDRLFGFNTQIRNYLNKYKQGKNADKYQTISTNDIYSISSDLVLLEDKINFLKNLSEQNVDNKKEEDNKTRDKFLSIIASNLKKDASKLTIKGVSILTPDDLALLDDKTIPIQVRIGKVEHNIYTKFREEAEKSSLKEAAIELFNNLNFDIANMALGSLESYGLKPDISSISQYDYFAYLTTILSVDQNDYYYKYKSYIQNQENDKVPLFSQEYATKLAYSFLADNELHDIVADWFNSKSPGYPATANKIFFLDGVSGSGKTTAVAKALLEITDSKEIIAAAPNSIQANKLSSSLGIKGKQALNKEELLRMFLEDKAYSLLEKDVQSGSNELIERKPVPGGGYDALKNASDESIYKQDVKVDFSVLFIDESTHFHTAELEVLNHAAKKYGFKIFAMGDTFQESAKHLNHIDSIFAWKPARLSLSIRPATVNKKETIDRFSTLLSQFYNEVRQTGDVIDANKKLFQSLQNNGIVLKYYEDAESLDGDKIVSEITSEDLNRLKRAAKGNKIGIITELDGAENKFDNIKDASLKAAIKNSELTDNDYILYSPDKISPFAVQGAEADYFVINDIGIFDNNTSLNLIRLYTFLTRSQNGTIIKLSDAITSKHNISNQVTQKPSVYKLPGLAQLPQIKQEVVERIDQIIGNYVPSESSTKNITQASVTDIEKQALDEAVLVDPKIIVEHDVTVEQAPEKNSASERDLLCYGFYNHTGLSYNDSLSCFISPSRTIPIDLYGIFPPNTNILKDLVLGFIKLKNLVTLYPNKNDKRFQNGLKKNSFTEDIAKFVKEITGKQEWDDSWALNWLIQHITIEDDDYAVGIRMDRNLDFPAFKFGFNEAELVEDGKPLILGAKRVKIIDDSIGFKFDRLITTNSFAKSSTILNYAPKEIKDSVYNEILALETKIAIDLKDKEYITYKLPKDTFKSFDRTDGRIVPKKDREPNFFDSLQKMKEYGVNIKEVGLISGIKNEQGKYRFIEWAKQYHPNIESFAIKDGKFLLSGKYFARVSYTNSEDSSQSDHLLILDLAQIKFTDAIKEIKNSSKNLSEMKKILHEKSQTDIVIDILKQAGAFQLNSNVGKTMFQSILEQFKKHESNHQQRIPVLEDFLKTEFTEDSVKELLQKPEMRSFGVIFVDYFMKDENTIQIDNNLIPYKSNEYGYRNISPLYNERTKIDGVYGLEDFNFNYLGLRNRHYEPRRYGISPEALNNFGNPIDIQQENTVQSVKKPTEKLSDTSKRLAQKQGTKITDGPDENTIIIDLGYGIPPFSANVNDIQFLNHEILYVTETGKIVTKLLRTGADWYVKGNDTVIKVTPEQISTLSEVDQIITNRDKMLFKDTISVGDIFDAFGVSSIYATKEKFYTDKGELTQDMIQEIKEKKQNQDQLHDKIGEIRNNLEEKLGTTDIVISNPSINEFGDLSFDITVFGETHAVDGQSFDVIDLFVAVDGTYTTKVDIDSSKDKYFLYNNKWYKKVDNPLTGDQIENFIENKGLNNDNIIDYVDAEIDGNIYVYVTFYDGHVEKYDYDDMTNDNENVKKLEENSEEDYNTIKETINEELFSGEGIPEDYEELVEFLAKYAKTTVNGLSLENNISLNEFNGLIELDEAYINKMGKAFKEEFKNICQ